MRSVLLWLLAVCAVAQVSSKTFRKNGKNVCEMTKVVTKSYKVSTVSHFPVSRNTNCGIFGWARCNVKRTATKTLYVINTKETYVTELYCCDGWRQRSVGNYYECDIPYCRLGCHNSGTCIGGTHRCKCPKGWTGDLCDKDVNECGQNNGGCQYECTNTPGSFKCGCPIGYEQDKQDKTRCQDMDECESLSCKCANSYSQCGAFCRNTIGSFKCSCGKGYRLASSTVCEDIDECLSPLTNNCTSNCVNMPGSYGCDCMKGFRLGKDSTTCEDINECALLSGACQHRCLNTYGSFVCQCRIGFKLHANRKRCSDIDECLTPYHGCEKLCNNTMGSYYCSCPKGFTSNDDKFTCSDVDECSLKKVKGLAGNASLSDCEQLCINTVGSFKCSCKRGYLLRNDGKTCKDADECFSGTHRCDHKCTNTFGSYVCSCRPGYSLTADRKACRPVPCESIEQPANGNIRCNGSWTDASCQFSCEPGYQLHGSKTRTCLPSSKWNGIKTYCKVKSCDELQVPDNAVILLPCYKTFKSQCTLQCQQGFYDKHGDGVATCEVENSGDMSWNLHNFKCTKLQICQPNPCRNNGKCLIQGRNYGCDCVGTGFEGSECQTGILTTPVFEKLKVNEQSKIYHFYAQPKNDLVVIIKSSKSLIIKPKRKLRISKSTKKATFSIVPLRPGLHVISYSLGGQDAKHYKVPSNSTVYVKSKDDDISVFNALKIPYKSIPVGCHKYSSLNGKCQSQLVSSQPWMKTRTAGIVHLMTKDTSYPISLFGTSAGENFAPSKKALIESIHAISSRNMNSSIFIKRDGKCEDLSMTSFHVIELIQTDAFPNTMINSLSSLLPKWIQFNVDKNNELFDVSNLMALLGKPPSHGPGSCERLPLTSSAANNLFYKPSISFNIQIDGERTEFGSSESACFAMDVCKNKMFIDFSPKARKIFHRMAAIQNMKNAGWDFDISKFGLRRNERTGQKDDFDIWMDGNSQIVLSKPRFSVGLNLTGEFTTRSACYDQIFTRQFECSMSGEFKGKLSVKSTIQESSRKTSLKFSSDETSVKFQYGGARNAANGVLPVRCGSSQGAHITFKSKDNPFQTSQLSHHILPYLQQLMNVTIYHSIEGGGQTGVKIPPDVKMKLMILGFVVKPFKLSLQGSAASLPQLQSELSQLLNIVTELDTLTAKANQVVNVNMQNKLQGTQAHEFQITISSITNLISEALSLCATLSNKLSASKPNVQAQTLKFGIQSFQQNIKTVKPLKLTAMRSPLKQGLKGLVVGTLAKVCLGQLCIPDVTASIDVMTGASKGGSHGDCKNKQYLRVIAISSKNRKVSKIITIKGKQAMEIKLSPQLLQFSGIVTIFGISQEARVNVNDRQLTTKLKAKIFNKFDCDVDIVADSAVEDWGSLVFKASGKMDNQSSLTRMLEERLNNYALDLIEKSEKRVMKAKSAFQNATLKTQHAKKLLNSTQAKFESLKKNETSLQKLLKRKKAFHAMVIDWFDNALENYNMTMSSRKSCTLTQCNRICNKTCIEDMCWDRATVQYQKADCSYEDSYIVKLMPKTTSAMITYLTTPTIRKDLGKCKNWITSFAEGVLTFGLSKLLGKRRKRSIEQDQNKPRNKRKVNININKYLRSRDPSLSRNFDINTSLRRKIPELPKDFDFNTALESYILKQHNFDINKLLKERFPALPANFDIDREILQAVPALARTFSFDEFLKNIVTEAARLKTPIELRNKLESLSPRLARDFDKVLRKAVPQLNNTFSITDLVQKYLGGIIVFSFDETKLDYFDVNDIIKSKFRGFPVDFDLNRLLLNQLPQLNATFNINILIKNAVLGVGPQAKHLDDLLANAAGVPGFSLKSSLSRKFPGFRFKLDDLITNEIKNLMSVKVNQTMLNTLTLNEILKRVLPKFRTDFDVDYVLINAFPSLKKKFELREILEGAIPLIKVIENLDLNHLIKGVYPSIEHINLDLDSALKRRNPALRGDVNVEKYLSQRLRDIVRPSFDKILHQGYHGISKMPVNFEKILEETIGTDSLEDLRGLVQNGVFPDLQDANPIPFNSRRGKRRNKRSFFKTVGKIIKTASNVISPVSNIVNSAIDASKNSGCTHKYQDTVGATESRKYKEIRTTLNDTKIPIKKWICKNPRMANMLSNGYRPRTCCRKDIDCVKFLDPVCVKENRNCFNQRRIEFRMTQSAFNASLFEEYHKLVSTESEVVDVAMRLEEVRLRKEVALQNVQIVKAKVDQLIALENTSRRIYHKVKSIPKVDLGFKVKGIVRVSFPDRPFRVPGLSFKTVSSTLSKRRLPFKTTIKRKRGKDLSLDFVIDFDNMNSSLSYATQEAIRLYTTSSRKRRSLALSADSSHDPDIDSCLLARNASLYMSDILDSLRMVMESKDDQDTKLKEEISSLDDAVSSLNPAKLDEAEDSTVKSYRHMLATYRNERREQTEMTPWNETLVSWKNYIENVTEIRQLPNCSGSVDCIEELKESLSEYYLELGNKSDVLRMVHMLDELATGITDLLTEEISYEQVKETFQRLSALLERTKDVNLLCSDKPKVLTRNPKLVKLLVGESAILLCNASSLSEIEYSWTRDDISIQTDKNGTLKLHNLQEKDEGLYRCMARNHKGSTFSGVTKIIIEEKPHIIEHPLPAKVPLDKESTVRFSCVASGKPLPTITWLYRPPLSNISVVLPDEISNILGITPDSVEKSGYYYCEAMNNRGVAVSREARLDIMPVTIATPKIAVIFNVTRKCKQPRCPDIPSVLTDELRKSVISMVTRSIGVSAKSISRLRYLRYSTSLARVVLYISTPLGNTSGDISRDLMMEKFSEGRLNLVGKLKRLLSAINKTVLVNDIPSAPLIGLSSTLGFVNVEPECPAGHWLDDNGFFCVHCPPGSFQENLQEACSKCPLGTYQPEPGQTDCISCSHYKTTLREGTIEKAGCIRTGPGKPERLKVDVLSSSSANVTWTRPPQSTITHYELMLQDGSFGGSILPLIKVHPSSPSQTDFEYTLRNLKKYTEYSLIVYGVMGTERGNAAPIYRFRTSEDVPAKSPQITSVVALNSTAVQVKWEKLPVNAWNGVPVSYTVYIKESSFAKYKKKEVDYKTLSTVITGLTHHTIYCVRITASTREGSFPDWGKNRCKWATTKKITM